MSKFRRCIIMSRLQHNYATGFYVLDSPTGFPLGKSYRAKMTISGSPYYYESDYPMYIYKISDTTFYMTYAIGHTWRNGSSYSATGAVAIGTIGAISYAREIYARSIPTNLCHSNYDMEFWG